jgi:hypothetical protein
MGYISPDKPAASCIGCFAWGVLPGRYCRACYTFGQLHDVGECGFCRRRVPIKKGYCRLCWLQASLEAKGQVTVLEPILQKLTHQQLFLSRMHRIRQPGPLLGRAGRRVRRPHPEPVQAAEEVSGWTQLRLLVETRRDYDQYERREHADLTNPMLMRARQAAREIGEARGWTRWVVSDVDRALVILLSSHTAGDRIRFSELFPVLRRYGLSVGRAVEILDPLGLFDDDRTPAFDTWLQSKLADLAPSIAASAEGWARLLHQGGPRNRARSRSTIYSYVTIVQPVLSAWSTRYDHLREVTRADVIAVRDDLLGSRRENTIVVLRSLFRHCKKTGQVFRDPTSRVHVARRPPGILLPLDQQDIDQAVAAARTPADLLIIVLAAVHAARPKAIRDLQLEDVDLGNRRLTIAGRARPLDDLTYQTMLAWLDYRRGRWPNTANPHLLLTQQTALEKGPAGKLWVTEVVRGLPATLERLRVDRQLDEALAHGPDPLHLATVFGLDPKTAIRYAEAARQLLQTAAEQQDPAGSREPKDQNDP